MGGRVESRTGVLAGVRSHLRDLTLPTTSYSTAVQRSIVIREDVDVNREILSRKCAEQIQGRVRRQVEVEVGDQQDNGNGGSGAVLRSSMDLNYLVSKMKPLFGSNKSRWGLDGGRGTGRGRDEEHSSSSNGCSSSRPLGNSSHFISKATTRVGINNISSSRTTDSTQKNTQQRSSGTKGTYDVSVSDASYVRTDTEGSVTLLISMTFQNISM